MNYPAASGRGIEKTNKFRAESVRLQEYDYSMEGAYFVTICTKNKKMSLGYIVRGQFRNTPQSKIIQKCWLDLPKHYPNCVLDEFVIMPNHVHSIIIINNPTVETGLKPVSTAVNSRHSLSEMVRAFKTFSAREINILQATQGQPFWQSRFYDHIIRNNYELNRIRQYIIDNPSNWEKDRNNNVENLYI
ncbi:MAG: transposase [Parcubacteria group bacterium LiPW_72]|nr:MAG: transposase [Parcubacteria group bacterium LiPW_72]